MARPVIAVMSDFGTRNHYAGTMKAVALGICPDATLVDLTHDIPPHDVLTASLELAASYRYFPAGTVFLVVVDPGVGSVRRGLAAETAEFRFVAPDNGVLTAVLRETPPRAVVELTERRYARASVSRTFEGRDRFAPAAGWLAKGIKLTALGRPAGDYVTIDIPEPEVSGDRIRGEVLQVDHFGNLVTNIDRKSFERLAQSAAISLVVGDHPVARFVDTYAEGASGEVCALIGSTDHVEIALNSGSAADELGLGPGAEVTISRDTR
jgi:S-adenosylmethionine hydrolase